jgi:hypothetical protein
MDRNEAMAEAIKNMEPALRVAGRTPDFGKFNVQFNMGMYSEPFLVKSAIDSSASDVVDSSSD